MKTLRFLVEFVLVIAGMVAIHLSLIATQPPTPIEWPNGQEELDSQTTK